MWYSRPEIHVKNSKRQNRPENSHAKARRNGVRCWVSGIRCQSLSRRTYRCFEESPNKEKLIAKLELFFFATQRKPDTKFHRSKIKVSGFRCQSPFRNQVSEDRKQKSYKVLHFPVFTICLLSSVFC